ncbi:Beta-galactosidase C-terminal domain, partial [Streptomyces sp. NPDC000188]
GLTVLLPELLAPAGVTSELPEHARGLVEHAVRRDAEHRYLFLVNRSDEQVALPGLTGDVLVAPRTEGDGLVLAPRQVAVLRQSAS